MPSPRTRRIERARAPRSSRPVRRFPGSRSSQRPCVWSMSSAAGVEDVEHEPPTGSRRPCTARTAATPVGLGLHVQQRAEGCEDERHRALDRRLAEVAVPEVQLDARELGPLARDLEHPLRGVDPDHGDSVGRERDRDPAGADAELDHRAARAAPPARGRTHVLDDARRPRVVEPWRSCRRRTCRYLARSMADWQRIEPRRLRDGDRRRRPGDPPSSRR